MSEFVLKDTFITDILGMLKICISKFLKFQFWIPVKSLKLGQNDFHVKPDLHLWTTVLSP